MTWMPEDELSENRPQLPGSLSCSELSSRPEKERRSLQLRRNIGSQTFLRCQAYSHQNSSFFREVLL